MTIIRAATTRQSLVIRDATIADASAVAAIYNQGIRARIATFETVERTAADVEGWLRTAYPFLVAETRAEGGTARVLGWVRASEYRPRDCYRGIAEFSVYVSEDARGRGVGDALMAAFIPACAKDGFWKVLSRIFPENAASRALCARHGFREVGTYEKHARLDGVWRDVVIVERVLAQPRMPEHPRGAHEQAQVSGSGNILAREIPREASAFSSSPRPMLSSSDFPAGAPERLALDYFARVWAPPHDVSAMDELMTEDVVLVSGGRTITGRKAFKAWVVEAQRFVRDVTNETLELIRNSAGDRLTHRWISRGLNNGLFGMPADGRVVVLTGITIWTVRDGRLSQCIAERNAWEVFQELGGDNRKGQPMTPATATARA